jgi:hypothetical protein
MIRAYNKAHESEDGDGAYSVKAKPKGSSEKTKPTKAPTPATKVLKGAAAALQKAAKGSPSMRSFYSRAPAQMADPETEATPAIGKGGKDTAAVQPVKPRSVVGDRRVPAKGAAGGQRPTKPKPVRPVAAVVSSASERSSGEEGGDPTAEEEGDDLDLAASTTAELLERFKQDRAAEKALKDTPSEEAREEEEEHSSGGR